MRTSLRGDAAAPTPNTASARRSPPASRTLPAPRRAMSRSTPRSSGRGLPSARSGSCRWPDAAAFSWAGPWIARRPARDGSGPRAVVMFGVPSGAIWDPADTADEILDGYVVAPLDLAAWPPRPAGEAGVGRVEALVIAPAAEAPVASVDEAVAVAGQGLQGDRYVAGAGTFALGPARQCADARRRRRPGLARPRRRPPPQRRRARHRSQRARRPRVHARRGALPRPPAVRAVRPSRSPQRRRCPTAAGASWRTARGRPASAAPCTSATGSRRSA